jgi:broad specificity phosphatase PhoE
MSVLVGRHGLSEANNYNNVGTLAFASEEAPLMKLGHEQARAMGEILISRYGIIPPYTPVASSVLRRTQQTAHSAGFVDIRTYTQLDEVNHGIDLGELRVTLDRGELPHVAIEAAETTLANPPGEDIWISHGLRIAGLCAVLGVYQNERLIPRFCELRKLPIKSPR